MSATGYLLIYTYAGRARLPLKNTIIQITDHYGKKLYSGYTDISGKLGPLEIIVPDRSNSLDPNPGTTPYARLNVAAKQPGYALILADNLQVFAGITTIQAFEMIPLPDAADQYDKTEKFDTPAQNL